MKKLISLATALLIFSGSAGASIDNVLDNMVTVHTSPPGVYKSPSMTTASLGSLSFRIRNDVLNMPLYTITPPRATLSCVGMDFDAGMIGMLNLDLIQSMLEQAGASFAWGVMIGLIYSLPGVADAFAKLNQWARYGQNLFANACNVGIQIGKDLGSGIFGSAATESAENAQATGIASTLNEAWKRIKSNLDKQKLYGNFPYSYFYETGFGSSDPDLADAIATYFGIVDFKPYDTSGNPCNSDDCLNAKNIRVIVYPPREVELSVLLDGGTITGYHCEWGLLNGVMTCKEIETNHSINVSEGLKIKVKKKIDQIVDNILAGASLTSDQIAFIYSFGDLSNFVNILSVIKKNLGDSAYQQYATALSNYLSLFIINSFIYSANEKLSTASSIFAQRKHTPTEAFNLMQERIKASKKQLKGMVDEYKRDIEFLKTAQYLYDNMKNLVDSRVAEVIGKPSFLFK
jgi:hypothetical protein